MPLSSHFSFSQFCYNVMPMFKLARVCVCVSLFGFGSSCLLYVFTVDLTFLYVWTWSLVILSPVLDTGRFHLSLVCLSVLLLVCLLAALVWAISLPSFLFFFLLPLVLSCMFVCALLPAMKPLFTLLWRLSHICLSFIESCQSEPGAGLTDGGLVLQESATPPPLGRFDTPNKPCWRMWSRRAPACDRITLWTAETTLQGLC